jgi:hypothetical protein
MNVNKYSVIGIATRFRLDGLGIESRWGGEILRRAQTGREAHPASYTMGEESFPGVKWPGSGVDHAPPSSAGVKERIEI